MTITLPDNARGPILDLELPSVLGMGLGPDEDLFDIILRNTTTGKSLRLNLPAGWDGDDISLDWLRRTIADQLGADRSALLDPAENELWLDRDPFIAGENDIEIEVRPGNEGTGLSTPWLSPGTVEVDSSAGVNNWSNPGNAKVSDDSRASATGNLGAVSRILRFRDFGAGIPSLANVTGVIFVLERRASAQIVGTEVNDKTVRVYKSGSLAGQNKSLGASVAWDTTDTEITYGGVADLWELGSLTGGQARSSSFGVGLQVEFDSPSELLALVDSARIKLVYDYEPEAIVYAAKATLRWEKGYY